MLKKDNKEKIDSENKNIVSNEEKQNNGCKQNKGITLVALVITILFSYDEKIKCSNSKGFLLTTI